jgi:CRP/FNR family cyclic AMP-dependent transcriptional regulator
MRSPGPDIQALRPSAAGMLPVADFHWLLDHSIGFNRFVMSLLNERLGQFIVASEADRSSDPDARVANHLLALFNPALCPGVDELLRITQQELAYLVGLSRQRVNKALRDLERRGVVRVEYGGVRLLDRESLRAAWPPGPFSRCGGASPMPRPRRPRRPPARPR